MSARVSPTGGPPAPPDTSTARAPTAPATPSGSRSRTRTWLPRLLDLVLAVVLYRVYAALRNAQGAGDVAGAPARLAERHGRDVLALERALDLDVEHGAQRVALALPHAVMRTADVYYAVVHLPLTAGVLVWLVLTLRPARYSRWRNRLVIGTALALVGFALFPTMPPRMLPHEHYVDALQRIGGLWSYRTPALEHIAHPFAAMPSLHLVWATWVGCALWSCARWRWVRVLGPVHVAVTTLVVLVTGNHYLLDAVAGCVVLGVATLLEAALHALVRRWRGSAHPGRTS